jgi:Tfp pilus assembly protein PilX
MTRALRHRLAREERGIALMVALAAMLALGIAVVAVISYTSANQRSTHLDQAELAAQQNAEAGMQQAYSVINYQNTSGGNPSAANLLGCAGSDGSASTTTAPSDCSPGSVSPLVVCVTAASGCSAGDAGSATAFGCYIGTQDGTCNMDGDSKSVTAANWLISSTGYARNPNTNTVVAKTVTATVTVTASSRGLAASVWNYLFSSAPADNGCDLDIDGQNVIVDVPLFVNGNLCLSGTNAGVAETSQAVDVLVMGKTVFSGGNTYVGTSSAPITSGLSVGGCTNNVNNSISNPANSCTKYPWHVTTTDQTPSETPTAPVPDFDYWYTNAPIGPSSGCSTSGTLAKSAFDNNTTRDNSASTFNLTPSTSYSCVSGSSELSWNASTKQLTVAGNIYIDGSATVSQAAYYTGTANLYLSGTFSFTSQNAGLCATGSTTCDWSTAAWSTSSNMLLIIPDDMAGTQNAVALNGNNNFLQAGILAPSTATISLGGNNVEFQGPIIGGKYTWGNNVELKPLPPITNMPPGAPVDPNVSVVIGSLDYQS